MEKLKRKAEKEKIQKQIQDYYKSRRVKCFGNFRPIKRFGFSR
jgi:hypothetical protein